MRDYIGNDELMGADQIVGLDQIVGGDLDQIVGLDILGADVVLGADARTVALAKRMAQQAMAKHAALVKQKQIIGNQEQVLPFPPTLVAAGLAATLTVQPQRTFRTERFAVASAIAAFFDITDLRIGQESMFVQVGQAPSQIFSEVGVGVRLRGYTANLGNLISLGVINTDVANRTFRGAIIGTAIVQP